MLMVSIYQTRGCNDARLAKSILAEHGVRPVEIYLDSDAARKSLIELTGGTAESPQIFIGNDHIGGLDQLRVLHRQKGALRSRLEQ